MSIHVTSWVLKHSNAKGTDRLALIVFSDHANDEGGNTYPSADLIAFEGRMSRSTAIACRKRLEAQGRLIPDGQDPWGNGIPNFRVRMDEEAEGPPPKMPDRNAWRRAEGRNPDPQSAAGEGANQAGEGPDEAASEGRNPGPKPSLGNRPEEPSSSSSPSEVERLCELMAKLSNERADSKRFKVTAEWRTEMDRLMRLDGRSPAQVEYVIGWVHRHSFWGPNVLSVPKLREKFDVLAARIKAERRSDQRSGDDLRAMADKARSEGR